MMEKIRTAANSMIVKIIFGLIIVSFIFAGVGGIFGSSSANDEQLYIAKVDGEGISRVGFEREAQVATQNAGTLGSDDAFVKYIRRGVLANQIDNFLAYKFSESLSTGIHDEQVKDAIRQQTVFWRNGRFDNQLYLELLALNNYTPDDYANALRASLQQQQVIVSLFGSEFVLPVDSDISTLIDQTRTAYVTSYSINNLDIESATDEDAAAYYDTNREQFFREQRVKIRYVTNFTPDIKKEINVTDNDVKKYYENNKAIYMKPAMHQYSIIDFSDLNAANEMHTKLTASPKDEELLSQLQDFGWFAVGNTLPDFLIEADLTKVGQFSTPIQLDDDFVIVRLNNLEAASVLPFEQAKNQVRQDLEQLQLDNLVNSRNEQLEKILAEGITSVDEIAEKANMQVYTSEWTYEKEALSIGRFPEVRDVIFSDLMIQDDKPTGNISDIIYVEQYNSTFVVQVTDYLPAGIAAFDEVKDQIVQTLTREHKKAVFHDNVNDILQKLQQNERVDGVRFAQRYTVSRNDESESLKKSTVDMIFSLEPSHNGSSVYGVDFVSDSEAVFAAMIKVDDGERSDISDEIQPQLMEKTRFYLANDLRNKAKIEIMPNANL